jgi:hypothetical protein
MRALVYHGPGNKARRGASFKEMAAALRRYRVSAVCDRLSYPDVYPIVAGPVF